VNNFKILDLKYPDLVLTRLILVDQRWVTSTRYYICILLITSPSKKKKVSNLYYKIPWWHREIWILIPVRRPKPYHWWVCLFMGGAKHSESEGKDNDSLKCFVNRLDS